MPTDMASLSAIFMCGSDMPHYEQFYVRPEDVEAEYFFLRDQECAHAARVCRKRAGEWLIAVDGLGQRYQGEIVQVSAEQVRVRRQQQDSNWGEPRLQLTLAQALLKGGHVDEIVEKATELGIARVQPLLTERTIVEPSLQRQERWQDKARAAMKQCGRSRCPVVALPMLLRRYIEQCAGIPLFVAEEAVDEKKATLSDRLVQAERAILVVGPEGGLSENEMALLQERQAFFFSLGRRRLRSETAALAAVTLLLAAANDLS